METTDIAYIAQMKMLRYILRSICIFACFSLMIYKRKINGSYICFGIIIIFASMVSSVEINLNNWWNDHVIYANWFLHANDENFITGGNDMLFHYYNKFLRKLTDSYSAYFFITSLIYSGCYYLSSKKLASRGSLIMFLMFCSSMFFVAYGVNTIRAGLAMSILIYGISSYKDNKTLFYILGICAINIHFSITLTFIAFIVANFLKTPKTCFYIWGGCVIASFCAGNWFENIFANIIDDSKFNSYVINSRDVQTLYKTGFRIDFILYSIIPILLGYYYIYRRHFRDKYYFTLYCTYIIANSFWVLVIRANFSDRFAYLSWALMPIVIIYPLLNQELYKRQYLLITFCLLCSTLFPMVI